MKKNCNYLIIISVILIITGAILSIDLKPKSELEQNNKNENEVLDSEITDNKNEELNSEIPSNENIDESNSKSFASSYWNLSETEEYYLLSLSTYICSENEITNLSKICNQLNASPLKYEKSVYKKIIPTKYGLDSMDKGQVSFFLIDTNNNVKRLSIDKFWNEGIIGLIDIYTVGDAIDIISVPDDVKTYPFYEEINTPVGTYGYEMFIVTSNNQYIRVDDELREEVKNIK